MSGKKPAPGIPDRRVFKEIKEKPGEWKYVVQRHEAFRAGPHFDVRLAPTKASHSWATRKLPEPGKSTLAKQQPTHDVSWHEFQGDIPRGLYGGGKVSTYAKGTAEVVEVSKDKVLFNIHDGRTTKEMVLVRPRADKPRDWLFLNRSTTPGKYQIPHEKPKYKSLPYTFSLTDTEGPLQPKVDGAHSLLLLEGGKRPRVFSYRESKRGDVLEYTHKIPGMFSQKVPKGVPKTILRAETYLSDPKGRAQPAFRTAGLLNSSVSKAREAQTTNKLRVMPFDVVGQESKPYADRLALIEKYTKGMQGVNLPPTAIEADAKRKMLLAIKSKKHPLTREGVVHWSPTGPQKAKLVDEADVYIRGVLPGTGKYRDRAGAFVYSSTPKGPVLGKVGTGISDRLRGDLWKNRSSYVGSVARVGYEKKTTKGALFAPRLVDIHIDKSLKGARSVKAKKK